MSGTSIGRRRRTFVAAMLMGGVMGSVAMPAVADATRHWRIIDLGVGDNSAASAINDRGHVVGHHGGRAFLWRDDKVTYLPLSDATDINNRDEVVGYQVIGDGTRAFRWHNGVMTDLGALPGSTNTYPQAINDHGEVVGSSWTASGGLRGFRWHSGVMTELAVQSTGSFSLAEDINNAGIIAGQSGDMNAAAAVRWLPGGSIEALIGSAYATAINERGHVIGLHYDDSGGNGFLWHRGQITEIEPVPGTSFIHLNGINNHAQIVGYTGGNAFFWQHGQFTLLPNLVATSGAVDINDRGHVVGHSRGDREGMFERAVLWTR